MNKESRIRCIRIPSANFDRQLALTASLSLPVSLPQPRSGCPIQCHLHSQPNRHGCMSCLYASGGNPTVSPNIESLFLCLALIQTACASLATSNTCQPCCFHLSLRYVCVFFSLWPPCTIRACTFTKKVGCVRTLSSMKEVDNIDRRKAYFWVSPCTVTSFDTCVDKRTLLRPSVKHDKHQALHDHDPFSHRFLFFLFACTGAL